MSVDQNVFWDAVSNRLQSMLQENGSAGTILRMGARCSRGCASNAQQRQVCPVSHCHLCHRSRPDNMVVPGKLYARWLVLRA